jgi:glycosyltransferase involved in cell wall biosynthesis
MAQIMHQSRYFLHALIDEPFGITAVQAIAAGCMPIVHDSGGQREVVPYTSLRYGSMDEIPGLIEALEHTGDSSFDALLDELLLHIKSHFTEDIFHNRITQVLSAKNIFLDLD